MQNLWYVLSALYMIALAFVSGGLVAHLALGSSAPGTAVSSSDVLTAVIECLGLVAVGVLGFLGKRWWQKTHADAVAAEEDEVRADAPSDAAAISLREAAAAATSSETAVRAESVVVETPIESLLAASAETAAFDATTRFADVALSPASQAPDVTPVIEPPSIPDTAPATFASDSDRHLPDDAVVEPLPTATHIVAAPIEEPVPVSKVIAEERVSLSSVEKSIAAETVSSEPISSEPVSFEAVSAEPVWRGPVSPEPVAGEPVQQKAGVLLPPSERPSLTIVTPSTSPIEEAVPAAAAQSASPVERPVAEQTVTPISSRAGTAAPLNDQRPRPVRKGYLFAPKIIWGNSRALLIRSWIIAALTAVASAAALFMLRDRASIAQLFVLAAIIVVATLGPLGHTLVVTAPSRRFGRTWVHLGTSPAAPKSEIAGTIWVSNQRLRHAVRSRQLIRPANVRLACVRPTGAASRQAPESSEVWHHEVAVRADRLTFMTGRLGIPFRFDLPPTVDHIRPDDQESLSWLLSVDTTLNGLELAEQFVLPLDPPEPTPLEASTASHETDRSHSVDRTRPLRRAR